MAFELNLDAIPEGKKKSTKTKPALESSALMPLSRDFAFLVAAETPAGELVRPIVGADKALIENGRAVGVRIQAALSPNCNPSRVNPARKTSIIRKVSSADE